jgi:hypothetical protein
MRQRFIRCLIASPSTFTSILPVIEVVAVEGLFSDWNSSKTRVVNPGPVFDPGIPISVNPEGLWDPGNQSRNRPGPTLEADLMPCSVWTFVRRTPVSIRFGQQPWGFVTLTIASVFVLSWSDVST